MVEKRRRIWWGIVPFLIGLLLIGAMSVLFGGPGVANADEPVCGDGVCDPTTENSDLCEADCECVDNGIADPGEGCGCKDVICAPLEPELPPPAERDEPRRMV